MEKGDHNNLDTGHFPDTSPKLDHTSKIPIEDSGKGRWERLWPVIACGAGLFSDGYLNAVSCSVFPTAVIPCCG